MRRRLLLGGVAVVTATLLLFAVPLVLLARGQATQAALDGLAARIEQVATAVDEGARTCAEVQLTLARLAGSRVEIALFDRDGGLRFAAGRDLDSGPVAAGTEVAVAADGATGRRVADGMLLVAVPLSTAVCGERLVLRGAADGADADATADRTTALLGLVAGAALLLGGGVAVVGGRRLVAPLEDLAASAERLGRGDFSERAPRSGLPEPDAIAEALDRTADRLGRAVERGAALAADASHQLRTPLTALRLHLEQLPGADDPDGAVAAALAEADRLEATVAELVALTDPGAVDEDVDVAALVVERADAWRARAEAFGRRLVVEAAPVPPCTLRPGAVAQAVEVLVDNALQHGRGTVVVRVQPSTPDEDRELVRVQVSDEGPGLPERARDLLARADRGPTSLPVHGGRGLRLARALVEGERGRLVVGPDGGGTPGTTLTLVLPARDAREGPAVPAPSP